MCVSWECVLPPLSYALSSSSPAIAIVEEGGEEAWLPVSVDIRRRRLSLLRSAIPPPSLLLPSSLPADQGRRRGKVRSRRAVSSTVRPSHADCSRA